MGMCGENFRPREVVYSAKAQGQERTLCIQEPQKVEYCLEHRQQVGMAGDEARVGVDRSQLSGGQMESGASS